MSCKTVECFSPKILTCITEGVAKYLGYLVEDLEEDLCILLRDKALAPSLTDYSLDPLDMRL